jgi:hypothetical protein
VAGVPVNDFGTLGGVPLWCGYGVPWCGRQFGRVEFPAYLATRKSETISPIGWEWKALYRTHEIAAP